MTNLVWVGVCLVTFFVGFTGGVIAMALASIAKDPPPPVELLIVEDIGSCADPDCVIHR